MSKWWAAKSLAAKNGGAFEVKPLTGPRCQGLIDDRRFFGGRTRPVLFGACIVTVLTTALGKVRSVSDGNVNTYLGVRYGQPPVGAMRFKASQMAGAWPGIYEATEYPNRAMQEKTLSTLGLPVGGAVSEDCLFLNIYVPNTQTASRPVLVWFHGGGFVAGSANEYDGSVLAEQGDVVVVTVNSRLGVFGFFDWSYFGSAYKGSASNGIRDQILALQWLRENIEDYGGDPSNVTIFGQSSGGSSVLALLAAPSADGLFHKAISCSGTAVYRPTADQTEKLAKRLGMQRDDLLESVLGMQASDILDFKMGGAFSVDGTVITRDTFQAIVERGTNGVPLIAGSNATEGSYYTRGLADAQDHHEWLNRYLATDMLCGRDPDAYFDALTEAYPGASPGKLHEMIWTDMFRRIAITAAETSAAHGAGGWLYRFDLPVNLEGSEHVGAPHAAEMAFTFNTVCRPTSHAYTFHDTRDPVVQRVGAHWSGLVLAMARRGNPNDYGQANLLPEWPQYHAAQRSCLRIDAQFSVAQDPDELHRSLWVAR